MLAYDGTSFHGWQVQPGLATVQGELRKAIERVTGENVLPQGSGRTDTGVHAEGQVASCMLAAPIPAANLVRALNRALPPAIRVIHAGPQPETFHARHSVVAKTYEYRIFRGEICPPWLAPFVYAFPAPLDVANLQRAAQDVCGAHDFTTFTANDPERSELTADPVRTITTSHWSLDGQMLRYRVRGNGFLHHMVRNLVGTFLDVGRGHLEAGAIPAILARRARSAAGPTAPARGLFLMNVEY